MEKQCIWLVFGLYIFMCWLSKSFLSKVLAHIGCYYLLIEKGRHNKFTLGDHEPFQIMWYWEIVLRQDKPCHMLRQDLLSYYEIIWWFKKLTCCITLVYSNAIYTSDFIYFCKDFRSSSRHVFLRFVILNSTLYFWVNADGFLSIWHVNCSIRFFLVRFV